MTTSTEVRGSGLSAAPPPGTLRPSAPGRRWRSYAARPAVLAASFLLLMWYLATARLDSIDRASLVPSTLEAEALQQLVLTAVSSAVVVALAISLGVLVTRRRAPIVNGGVGALATLGQASPPIGLMILAGLFIGVGTRSAIYALIAYSALPVLRNTITGLNGLDQGVLEAARGVGMRPWRVLTRIELPLAEPVIVAGIRTAIVLNVGTATLATFINGGGLGTTITAGIAVDRAPVIIAGSVLVAIFALLLDWVVGIAGEVLRPRGLGVG